MIYLLKIKYKNGEKLIESWSQESCLYMHG